MKKYLKLLIAICFCTVLAYGFAKAIQPLPKDVSKGELAPDFRLSDLQKNDILLSGYRDKKPVVLVFWTTWCPYCRTALKSINTQYPDLSKKGWEILAINVEEPQALVQAFVSKYDLALRVLLDKTSTVTSSYGVLGLPTYAIIDKKGKLVYFGNYLDIEQFSGLVSE